MNKNEFGRSMVEILGVLAIISVLSVAGTYGYIYAMRKHKTNEIIQVISVLYTMAHSANSGDGDCVKLSTTSLPKNPSGVSIDIAADASVDGAKPTIDIQINNSEYEKICTLIREAIPSNAEYEINNCGQTSVSCNSGTN